MRILLTEKLHRSPLQYAGVADGWGRWRPAQNTAIVISKHHMSLTSLGCLVFGWRTVLTRNVATV